MQDMSFRCTGNGPATHVECEFVATTMESAVEHFETTGHDVAVPETVCTLCAGTGDIDIDETLTVKCSECLGTGNADTARENAARDQAATDAETGQWNPYAWSSRQGQS